MKQITIKQLPEGAEEAMAFLHQEVIELQEAVMDTRNSLFEVVHVAPAKPREGLIRLADGSNWNPGSGRGLYQYVSGAWVKL